MSGRGPAPDPAAEAALLAEALRAHAGRLARRGARRVAAAQPRPAPATPAPPSRAAAAAPPGPAAQAPLRPAAQAPVQPAAPSPAGPPGRPGPAPRPWERPRREPGAAPRPWERPRPEPAAAAPSERAPAAPAAPAPPLPEAVAGLRARAAACADLGALEREVAACTACPLARTRTQTVFADGRGRIPLMFVGEAPGADEDAQGLPFVGAAGRLLTDIITKGMGLAREDVTIANVLKCRPPGNRDPLPEEKALCTAWLDRQIELVDPRVIVPLGRHAANHVLGTDETMGRLRGRVHEARGRQVVPTYHPSYLLRTPGDKRKCWEDIQLAMRLLGLSPPGRGGDSAPRR